MIGLVELHAKVGRARDANGEDDAAKEAAHVEPIVNWYFRHYWKRRRHCLVAAAACSSCIG